MSAFDREPLEKIAADIIYLSMEYLYSMTYDEILEEAKKLTDKELVDFLAREDYETIDYMASIQ